MTDPDSQVTDTSLYFNCGPASCA